jgi:hypothetical protein
MDSMSTTDQDLRELVHKHKVCYEVYSEYAFIHDQKVQSGFDVELHGVREQDAMRLTPGDKSSHLVYSDLQNIAQFALPTESDDNEYRIEPFDCALHESTRHHLRPEVICTIGVTHPDGTSVQDPADDACLASIETKLKSLDIPRAH